MNPAKRRLERFKAISGLQDGTHMGVSENAKFPKLIEQNENIKTLF